MKPETTSLTPAQLGDPTVPVTPRFIADYLTWAWQGRRRPQSTLPFTCYRGLADTSWQLLPTLCRKPRPVQFLQQVERETISEFRGSFDLAGWSDIEVLAYARHHGAPTRLMDWSRNPLVGVWFAVSDKNLDAHDGVIHELSMLSNPPHICVAIQFELERAESCKCGRPVHVFTSPHKIDRTRRQGSIFTITALKNDTALKPLDALDSNATSPAIRQFLVPAGAKARIRTGLAELGLDAYSIYGDADSFGEKLTALFTP